MNSGLASIVPDWLAPPRVRAAVTTRRGGVSQGPYGSFNLAQHVGDDPDAVAENRRRLRDALKLPGEPKWLNQVHGTRVVQAPCAGTPAADAAFTDDAGTVCAIMTADCLPVLLCDERGIVVGAAHAGWRGLAGGVLEATVAGMAVGPRRLLAWLGPAIGPYAFEVGEDVRQAFLASDPGAGACFETAPAAGKLFCDLYGLARRRLHAAGVERVYGGGRCTYSEPQSFFSYRRDRECGRMASLIWLED
ncbi:MAG: peptidoglycan editing factor PgeF [Gammaproteobacteria bacterium]|nr:peptidoglycan editing factor PgeF [Gammaproteobacteria bacterium]